MKSNIAKFEVEASLLRTEYVICAKYYYAI